MRLREPLWVEIDNSGDGATASAIQLECYGMGDTEPEALEDLSRSLVSDYRFLLENEHKLGVHPLRLLTLFRELVEETA